jgi:hypothetical protein
MGFFIKIYDKSILVFDSLRILLANFYRPIYMKLFYISAFVLNLFLWIFSYFMFSNITQDRLILHHNVDMGIDLIGGKGEIFSLPMFGLVIIFLNMTLLLVLLKRKFADYKFVSRYSSAFMVFSQLLLVLAVFSIYSINFK